MPLGEAASSIYLRVKLRPWIHAAVELEAWIIQVGLTVEHYSSPQAPAPFPSPILACLGSN
jgi:hypothetical protein